MRTAFFTIILNLFFVTIAFAQVDTTSTYYFAHSLISHQKTTSNQANIPYWLAELEMAVGNTCLTSGQFAPGQFGSSALPPQQTWSFYYPNDNHSSAMTPGSSYPVNAHDNVVLTYMNWQIIYDYGQQIGQRQTNEVSLATDSISLIFNWMKTNDPMATLYLYECWPKIETNFILGGNSWNGSSGSPPDSVQWATYLNYALSKSHDFWIELQDSLISVGNLPNLKLIPSSLICSKLWQQGGILDDFMVTDIFEDQGPHGLPSSYFLAAMVVYAAQHGQAPTKPFNSHLQIDQRILNRFDTIASFIITELSNFKFTNDSSRVWFEGQATTITDFKGLDNLIIYPNPAKDYLIVNTGDYFTHTTYTISIVNSIGQTVFEKVMDQQELRINLNTFGGSGIYFVRILDDQGYLKDIRKLINLQ
jgi:hypothetical protein